MQIRGYDRASYKEKEVYKCDFLNLRSGAGTKYRVLAKLHPDRIVEVVSTTGNWAKVQYKGGYAYCSLSYIRDVKHTTYRENTTIYKIKEAINLRKTADWNGTILKVAPKNMLLDVIEITSDGNWAKVWYANKVMYAPYKNGSKYYLTNTGQIKPGSGEDPALPDPEIPTYVLEKEIVRPTLLYKNDYWIDIYNPDMPNFKLNTSELDMHMLEKPIEVMPLLKYDSVDNLNYDGDFATTYDTFNTTEIELEFYIKEENYSYIMSQLKKVIRMPTFRLTFGWDRRFFVNARISDNIEIEEFQFDDICAKIIITFEIQPYRYAWKGVYYTKDIKTNDTFLINNSTILNHFEESYPKIFFPIPHTSLCKANSDNEKAITISMYNHNEDTYSYYHIKAHDLSYAGEPIKYIYAVLDSTTGNLYEDTTDKNLNYLYKIENDFPTIKPGKTTINQSENFIDEKGDFLKMKIIPNWRAL